MEPKNLTGNYGPKCFETRVKGMKNISKLGEKIPTMGQKVTLLPLVEPELHELTHQSNNMTTKWIPREILFSSVHETVTKMSAI